MPVFYVLLDMRPLALFMLANFKKLLFGDAYVKSSIYKPLSRAKHISTQLLSVAPADLCRPPNTVPTS